MARSFSLAAYLALHRGPAPEADASAWPDRPKGPLVWICCGSPARLRAAETIANLYEMEDLAVEFLITGAEHSSQFYNAKTPVRSDLPVFLDHWAPDAVIWLGAENLNPASVVAAKNRDIPSLLLEVSSFDLVHAQNNWFPGMSRAVFGQIDHILCADTDAQNRILRAGYPASRIDTLGALDEDADVLPYDEAQFNQVINAIGTRQTWLAAHIQIGEAMLLASAHKHACRRAHRLLLIVVPDSNANATELADAFLSQGFETLLSHHGTEVNETTRVLIVRDGADNLGLWHRVSPITYAGGTIIGGVPSDPFGPAALGSSVIHGPIFGTYGQRYASLDNAGGSLVVRSAADLGPAVETLLSPDRNASVAMAAWGVTSGSADTTNLIAGLLRDILERKGY